MNTKQEVKVLKRSMFISAGVAGASVGFLLRRYHDRNKKEMTAESARNIGIAAISGTFALSHLAVGAVLYATTDVFNQ